VNHKICRIRYSILREKTFQAPYLVTLVLHRNVWSYVWQHWFCSKGFFEWRIHTLTSKERQEVIQLNSLYGPEAEKYVAYHEKYGAKKNLLLPYEELVMAHQWTSWLKTIYTTILYFRRWNSQYQSWLYGALNAAYYIAQFKNYRWISILLEKLNKLSRNNFRRNHCSNWG
jgi:hypothetical protein